MAVDVIANLIFFVLGVFGISINSLVKGDTLLLVISILFILYAFYNGFKSIYFLHKSLKST